MPPGSKSKFSSSMASSMRALILRTLETSSRESCFFSRAWRNLFPNWPMIRNRSPEHDRPSGERWLLTRVTGPAGQEPVSGVQVWRVSKSLSPVAEACPTCWEMPVLRSGGLGGFADGDGELGFAGIGGIVECVAGAVAFRGLEEQSVLEVIGEAGEARLAVDVGPDFEVELVSIEESVGNADVNLGVVDRLVVSIGDGEIRGARAEAAINCGDGMRVGLGGCVLRGEREGEGQKNEHEPKWAINCHGIQEYDGRCSRRKNEKVRRRKMRKHGRATAVSQRDLAGEFL